jgi:hypothetical protein
MSTNCPPVSGRSESGSADLLFLSCAISLIVHNG